jgi:hypothetical protein
MLVLNNISHGHEASALVSLRGVAEYQSVNLSIGIQFSDTTVWLAIAMTLSVFQISKAAEEGTGITLGKSKPSAPARCASLASHVVVSRRLTCACQSSKPIQLQDRSSVYKGRRTHPPVVVDVGGCVLQNQDGSLVVVVIQRALVSRPGGHNLECIYCCRTSTTAAFRAYWAFDNTAPKLL